MTSNECMGLPNRTPVRLSDGRNGVIVVWHKATAAVGVRVGEAVLTVSCEDLGFDRTGAVVQRAP